MVKNKLRVKARYDRNTNIVTGYFHDMEYQYNSLEYKEMLKEGNFIEIDKEDIYTVTQEDIYRSIYDMCVIDGIYQKHTNELKSIERLRFEKTIKLEDYYSNNDCWMVSLFFNNSNSSIAKIQKWFLENIPALDSIILPDGQEIFLTKDIKNKIIKEASSIGTQIYKQYILSKNNIEKSTDRDMLIDKNTYISNLIDVNRNIVI